MGNGPISPIPTPAEAHTNWSGTSWEELRSHAGRRFYCREANIVAATAASIATATATPCSSTPHVTPARRVRASSPIGPLAAVNATEFLGTQRIGVDDISQRPEPAAATSN